MYNIDRPRPLSVPEAAAVLQASEAYVRRLLIGRRLYGVKVGPVWAIHPEDLESFRRLRRPPGRPQKTAERLGEEAAMRVRINSERASAGTDSVLRKPGRSRKKPRTGA
jgi:excisionase family DNA binding protein